MEQQVKKKTTIPEQTMISQEEPNLTGIPLRIKNAWEAATGVYFGDVRLHYNSSLPEKLNCEAFAKGDHIYFRTGQQDKLNHELGHLWQQKIQMIPSTKTIRGQLVNDDPKLEEAADRKAAEVSRFPGEKKTAPLIRLHAKSQIAQCKVGAEFQAIGKRTGEFYDVMMGELTNKEKKIYQIHKDGLEPSGHGEALLDKKDQGFRITADMGDYEYVTEPVNEEGEQGIASLEKACENAAKAHKNIQTALDLEDAQKVEVKEKDNEGKTGEYWIYPKDAKINQKVYFLRKSVATTAHPQATMGIKLNNLSNALHLLLKKMNSDSPEEPKEQVGGVDDLYLRHGGTRRTLRRIQIKGAKALDERPDPWKTKASKRFQQRRSGLVMMLASMAQGFNDYYTHYRNRYIRKYGEKTVEKKDVEYKFVPINAKTAMPIMPRTTLYHVYQAMGVKNQKVIRKLAKDQKDDESEKILKYIVGNSPWRKGKSGKIKKEDPGNNMLNVILAGQEGIIVSLRDWLNGINTQPTNPFSKFSGVDGIKDENSLYEGMKRTTDIGRDYSVQESGEKKEVLGMLVEIRDFQRRVPTKNWGKFGRDVAYMARFMNKDK